MSEWDLNIGKAGTMLDPEAVKLTLIALAIVLVTTLLLWLLPFRMIIYLALSFVLLAVWALYETSNEGHHS
jgi:hypothetical protein